MPQIPKTRYQNLPKTTTSTSNTSSNRECTRSKNIEPWLNSLAYARLSHMKDGTTSENEKKTPVFKCPSLVCYYPVSAITQSKDHQHRRRTNETTTFPYSMHNIFERSCAPSHRKQKKAAAVRHNFSCNSRYLVTVRNNRTTIIVFNKIGPFQLLLDSTLCFTIVTTMHLQ